MYNSTIVHDSFAGYWGDGCLVRCHGDFPVGCEAHELVSVPGAESWLGALQTGRSVGISINHATLDRSLYLISLNFYALISVPLLRV